MKPGQLLRAILPDVLIDNFDIVNFDKSADRFDIYLDEKKFFLNRFSQCTGSFMNSDIKIKKSNCPSRTAAPVKRFNISKK